MATRLLAAVILVLSALGSAGAEPLDRGGGRDGSLPERSEAREVATPGSTLDLPVRLDLSVERLLPPTRDAALTFRSAPLPPDSFCLRLDLGSRFGLYVSADLDAELPRLDAVDGDTYFTTGAELRATRDVRLFVEDFQPASMVVGGGPTLEAAPLYSWDGHQVSLGVRFGRDLQLEVAAVLHVLSATRREDSVGAIVALSQRF